MISNSTSLVEVNEDVINDDLFGIKYHIDNRNVKIAKFTPSILDNKYYNDLTTISQRSQGLNSYQVSLVSPSFLPLKLSLNGLYEKCLKYLSEVLDLNEKITIIWLFNRKGKWSNEAISLYECYLKGVNSPSNIDLLRGIQFKIAKTANKVFKIEREYSEYVERKMLDEAYYFQCIIEIESDRSNLLSGLIQDIFAQYDFQNGLRVEKIDYIYPYTFNKTDQLIGKSEMMSLFYQHEYEINLQPNPIENHIKKESNDHSIISCLPHIDKKEVKRDENIVEKLANALKRVGTIKQARLYNESVQYGSRLMLINADIPKDKNFSDIEKKREDIQVAMGVSSLSIEQGDRPSTVKFSIPHNEHQIISLRELIEDSKFQEYKNKKDLAFIVGVDEIGEAIYASLKDLVHLGIYGTTGSGKSVFLNQLIATLLICNTPDELNLVLIDPKQVELNQYEKFPHVREVITNMAKAVKTFNGLVREMDDRYKSFSEINVKDIDGYNRKSKEKLPRVVCVVEEWADLHSVAGRDAEEVVMRLGQKARAAGIHLIIVTQRPSVKVLSGDIKSNIQNVISFNLGTSTNYRTVFDCKIPYELMGRGDGVFRFVEWHKEFQRFQSPKMTEDDLEEEGVCNKLAKYYSNYKPKNNTGEATEDEDLVKLKQIIAQTKETRITVLREKMKIKSDTLYSLMNKLVEENWLIKHKNRAKGYELSASEEEMNKYVDENMEG